MKEKKIIHINYLISSNLYKKKKKLFSKIHGTISCTSNQSILIFIINKINYTPHVGINSCTQCHSTIEIKTSTPKPWGVKVKRYSFLENSRKAVEKNV